MNPEQCKCFRIHLFFPMKLIWKFIICIFSNILDLTANDRVVQERQMLKSVIAEEKARESDLFEKIENIKLATPPLRKHEKQQLHAYEDQLLEIRNHIYNREREMIRFDRIYRQLQEYKVKNAN